MKNIQSISNGILPKNLHQNSSESFNSIGTRFQSVNNVIQKKFEMESLVKLIRRKSAENLRIEKLY